MTSRKTPETALLAIAGALLLAPAPAPADHLIFDDLIVDGSACVGTDCVNDELFGYSTLVLKENNTRLMFHDTSNSASFPSNDWVIQANQTSNGSANSLSVIDCGNVGSSKANDCGVTGVLTIEAGAGDNALYVDDGGRVGLGTSVPALELHLKDGDTPSVRLEQDASSGFTSQIWDLAGNETNFFIRDTTSGSAMSFRIRRGAPANSIYVDPSGDIGAGTSSPAEELHIRRNDGDDVFVQIEAQDAQNAGLVLANSADFFTNFIDTAGDFVISTDGGPAFEFEIDGGTGNVTIGADLTVDGTIFGTVSSSRADKTAIEPVDPTEVLARVAAMPMAEWSYALGTPADRERHMGPMAEDFHAAFGLGRDDTSISLVDYSGVALAAIQGLHREVERLHERVLELEAALAESRRAD